MQTKVTDVFASKMPKLKSDSGSGFSQTMTPGPKEKCRILLESTPALWIRGRSRLRHSGSRATSVRCQVQECFPLTNGESPQKVPLILFCDNSFRYVIGNWQQNDQFCTKKFSRVTCTLQFEWQCALSFWLCQITHAQTHTHTVQRAQSPGTNSSTLVRDAWRTRV